MIKFNKSYAIANIRAITWVICVCIFALSLLPLTAAAQGITAKELDKKKDEYRNAEGALGNAVDHLGSLARTRDVTKNAWDDNREELRDAGITAAGNLVSLATMILLFPIAPDGLVSALSTAITSASLTAFDIREQITLDALLTIAISAVNSKQSEIGDENSGLVKARNDVPSSIVDNAPLCPTVLFSVSL